MALSLSDVHEKSMKPKAVHERAPALASAPRLDFLLKGCAYRILYQLVLYETIHVRWPLSKLMAQSLH
jgi:hypothetical protein